MSKEEIRVLFFFITSADSAGSTDAFMMKKNVFLKRAKKQQLKLWLFIPTADIYSRFSPFSLTWDRPIFSTALFPVLHDHTIGLSYHDPLIVPGFATRSQNEHPPPSLEACSILTSDLHPVVMCWICIRCFFSHPVS